jgi:hypothetical protein
MKCKYCGYEIKRSGCLSTDGKNYHKGCLENYILRTSKVN